MRRRSFQDQTAAAAYHEAGHAVMCHLMHLRIKSISIDAADRDGGQMTHENPFHGMNPAVGDTLRTRRQVEKTIMLCLAGPLAQEKYAPRDPRRDYGGAFDVDTASTLAMRFFRSRKTAAAYINFATEWARQKLDDPPTWAAVERLARALLRQRKISGRQAEAIIRGSSGVLRRQTRFPLRRAAPAPLATTTAIGDRARNG